MKKSFFWCLMAIFWIAQTVWSVVRFFDIHITVENKKGHMIKTISRKGDRVTERRVVSAALSLLLCNLYAGLFFKARKRERAANGDCP